MLCTGIIGHTLTYEINEVHDSDTSFEKSQLKKGDLEKIMQAY